MARRILTGDRELEAVLKSLKDKAADRVAKSTLGAGLTVLAAEIKKEAPLGRTGALKLSIGKRNVKNKRSGQHEAKAGVNVGKRTPKRKGRFAPHAHLVALGTQSRTGSKGRKKIGGKFSYITNPTEAQLSTGVMPKNDFVKRGARNAKSKLPVRMKKAATKALDREAKKAAKGRQ